MPILKILNVFLILGFIIQCSAELNPVRTGLDRIDEFSGLFEGKRLGIITNHTAVNSEGVHISTLFTEMKNTEVVAFFGPEHGIKGEAEAGEKIGSERDGRRIPVYSLYGETRKPTAEMLTAVDVLVFDIQDIGARFYTYIQTMALAMEAAAEQGITFVVLDRPNPIGGIAVEGNLVRPEHYSFVGLFPIPVRHGMTVAELAAMINTEGWLEDGIRADLKAIPLENWNRTMWFDETGLTFIKPSPNIPDLETATVYPGLCLLEGTNVSEGRGTMQPFLVFGAPWIDAGALSAALNDPGMEGVRFEPWRFTPEPIEGMAGNPKHANRECRGAKIIVENRSVFDAYWTGIRITDTIRRLYPDSFSWREWHFDRLCGTSKIRETIERQSELDSLKVFVDEQEATFRERRKSYLLYR